MTIAPALNSVFAEISEEHQRIDALLVLLQSTFARGRKNLPLISQLLGELTKQLGQHFEHEESGGYFDEVIELAPRFTPTIIRLREEHSWLMNFVKQLHHQSTFAPDSAIWWQATRCDFEKFLRQFSEHESCEDNLIQEAYTQDLGEG